MLARGHGVRYAKSHVPILVLRSREHWCRVYHNHGRKVAFEIVMLRSEGLTQD